jgi:hypothetical protein
MKIEIKHRYTHNVLYACEAENLKSAVVEAVENGVNLSGADLRGADLSNTNLYGTDLRNTDLRGTNLRGADLSNTDLRGTNLYGTDLSNTDLRGTNLRGADLRGADLSNTDLRCTNLSNTDLRCTNLRGADLGGEILAITPIFINGLIWDICITESFMKIGCERHKHKEWAGFPEDEIARMESRASVFWKANKSWLLTACKAHRKESLAARKAKNET